MKSAMVKVIGNSKLTQEWTDFRTKKNKENAGDVEMTSCSLAKRKMGEYVCTDVKDSDACNVTMSTNITVKVQAHKKSKITTNDTTTDSTKISNNVATIVNATSTRIGRVCKPKQYYE